MSKAVKLKNDNYLDSTSIVHNKRKLSTILDEIEIVEVIENENGTAIKYANGTLICFGNIVLNDVNIAHVYGNVFTEKTGNRHINFPAPFKDTTYIIDVYVKYFSGGIGGICGSGYSVNRISYWLWHAQTYNFTGKEIIVSYKAIGRWK